MRGSVALAVCLALLAVNVTASASGGAGVTLAQVDPGTRDASPGDELAFTVIVKNTGSSPDTFDLTVTTSPPSGATLSPVTLDAGASQEATLAFVVPSGVASGSVRITAASERDPAHATASVAWGYRVPLVGAIVMAQSAYSPLDEVSGIARVTYLNGAPVGGANVTLTQTPQVVGAMLDSGASGSTGEDGLLAFRFGLDVGSRMLGHHDVLATIAANGASTAARASYDVAA